MKVLSNRLKSAAIALALVSAVAGLCSAAGDRRDSGPLSIDEDRIEVGFDGFYKVGCWTPLTVTVTTTRPMRVELEVETADPDGNLATLPTSTIDLAAPGTHRLQTVFKSGRIESTLRIRIREGPSTIASAIVRPATDQGKGNGLRPLRKQSTFLVVTLGHPAGFDEAESKSARPMADDAFRVVELDREGRLPTDVHAYDSVDALVIAGHYELDRQRSDAIRDWVHLGGHLVLSVGSDVAGYKKSPLDLWVPVPVENEPLRLRELSGLESFADKNVPIGILGRVDAAKITGDEIRAGRVLASGLSGPLLVRVPFGFGRVTFFALDLDRPPLSTWKPLTNICRALVAGDRQASPQGRPSRGSQLARTGITDLATQLHAVQEHFPDVRRSSSWLVMGLMVLYLMAIGPLDYLIVHRVLQRPRLTWFTFPAMVVVCALTAIWSARASNGVEVRLNQIDVVDIDGQSQSIRAQSWMTIYSPQNKRYRVSLETLDPDWNGSHDGQSAPATTTTPRVSWNGIPEDGFGGMYRTGGTELSRAGYRFAVNAAVLEDLPIRIWSTKGLTATWSYRSESQTALVESKLWSTGARDLQGIFLHRLPAAITDWMIAYGNRVYRPATGLRGGAHFWELAPGRSVELKRPQVDPRELHGYLTGTRQRRVEKKKGGLDETQILVEQTKYDPLNRDPTDVVRMITFHEAAGGKAYTHLGNNMLRRLDLSAMRHLDRAVLFGRIDHSAARLLLDGEPVAAGRRDTFVRILLPVERRRSDTRRQLLNFKDHKD